MLPKHISPCPINEAVVELRFSSTLPSDAIFGVVFNDLKDSYAESVKLPILQLLEAVRNEDPKFVFQPHYRLMNNKFAIQVGPRVVSIAITDQSYSTWESYLDEIVRVFGRISDLGFISEVTRVGIRYVNLFPGNAWSNLRVSLSIGGDQIDEEEVFVRAKLDRGDFKVLLQIVNQLSVQRNGINGESVTALTSIRISNGRKLISLKRWPKFLTKAIELRKKYFSGFLARNSCQNLARSISL
jgi:uncharacterized protein (TIGR04255 family)